MSQRRAGSYFAWRERPPGFQALVHLNRRHLGELFLVQPAIPVDIESLECLLRHLLSGSLLETDISVVIGVIQFPWGCHPPRLLLEVSRSMSRAGKAKNRDKQPERIHGYLLA